MQNRELSWLTFNERVLDQGADETVPLLERLNFISIFWSNLQEFFMVRVGSLTDLSLLKKQVLDSKTGMTPAEQLSAIHKRCHQLYPVQEQTYAEVRQAASRARRAPPAPRRSQRRAARLPGRLHGSQHHAVPVPADHQFAPPLPPPGERVALRHRAP